MKLAKPPLLASVMTVAGVGVLCALGTWQLHRLAWKTDLLAQIDREAARTPELLDFTALPADTPFRRGIVAGRLLHDKEIPLGPRTYEGQPGYHILTPLALPDGSFIMVNRGWVPLEQKDAQARPESVNSNRLNITGLLRQPERANIFVPANDPAQNAWYRPDLAEIARAEHLGNLRPFIFYAEEQTGAAPYPLAQAAKPQLNNNHLQYAVFWFTMAVILVGVYAARFLKPHK